MPRTPRLTPELTRRIVSFIRAGGYDWVAAQAAGVSLAVFRGWLERGVASSRQPYRGLYLEVEQAKGHARLSAEIQVREKDAKVWLRYGPGRETVDAPGWTVAAKPAPAAGPEQEGWSMAQVLELMGEVQQTLSIFPEAAAAVEQTLADSAMKPTRRAG
jgi:hypothetical protein